MRPRIICGSFQFGRDNIRKLLKDKEMALSFERILSQLDEKNGF
jgi:aminopeptidase N